MYFAFFIIELIIHSRLLL